jgi:hypothetical protein
MITLRVWFLVIAAAVVALAMGAWTTLGKPVRINQTPSSSPTVFASPTRSGSDAGHASSLSVNQDALENLLQSAEPHVDVYGNEIEDAVSDYRIDPAGDVYERHSPETEVPRLAPPVI